MPAYVNEINLAFMLILLMVLKFSMNKSHILLELLMLEAMMLINLLLLMSLSEMTLYPLILCFISFSVMEACIGLAAMIQITRLYGHASLYTLYSFKLNKLSSFKVENN